MQPPPGCLRPTGYLCQAVARSPDVAATWHLARYETTTIDAALAWMRDQADHLSAALLRPDGVDVWARWRADRPFQQLQRQHLIAGAPISINEARSDQLHTRTVTVMYSLSCTPITITTSARVHALTPEPAPASAPNRPRPRHRDSVAAAMTTAGCALVVGAPLLAVAACDALKSAGL